MKGFSLRCLGEKVESFYREKSEKMRKNYIDPFYRNLNFSIDRELSRIKNCEIELSRSY